MAYNKNYKEIIINFLKRFFLLCLTVIIAIIGIWSTAVFFNILIWGGSFREIVLLVILCGGSLLLFTIHGFSGTSNILLVENL
jgi:hypothetical protein